MKGFSAIGNSIKSAYLPWEVVFPLLNKYQLQLDSLLPVLFGQVSRRPHNEKIKY